MENRFYANFDFLCDFYCIDKDYVLQKIKLSPETFQELKDKNELPSDNVIQFFARLFEISSLELLYSDMSSKLNSRRKTNDKSSSVSSFNFDVSDVCRCLLSILFIAQVFLFFAPFCSVNDAGNSTINLVTLSACFSLNSVSIKFLEIIYSLFIISSIMQCVVQSCEVCFKFPKKIENFSYIVKYIFSFLNISCFALLCVVILPLENLTLEYGAVLSIIVSLLSFITITAFARQVVTFKKNK